MSILARYIIYIILSSSSFPSGASKFVHILDLLFCVECVFLSISISISISCICFLPMLPPHHFFFFFIIIFFFSSVVLSSSPHLPNPSPSIQEWRYGRVLLQATNSTFVSEDYLILAEHRTQRRDPLNGFAVYREGWNVTNEHYWASVGYTAWPGFLLAALWLLLGLGCVLLLCCCCCCCSSHLKGSHSGDVCLPLLFLLLFTGAAVAGSVLVYIYQGQAHNELQKTLDYVVGESDQVVSELHNTTSYLQNAQSLTAVDYVLSDAKKARLQQLTVQLSAASNTLQTKTHQNEKNIRNVIDDVRLAMIVVAGAMLLAIILGFIFSTLGMTPLMSILIAVVWFLVAGTWILCGVYIMLNNVVGDACVAMEEWVANPSAKTALEDILPCVDINTTDAALSQTRDTVNDTISGINQKIQSKINNGSASGPLPEICNPLQPSVSPPNCVNITDAAHAWSTYVCANDTSSNAACKLTAQVYDQLNKTAAVITGLNENIPFLLDLANCNFVRNVFTTIYEQHCRKLRKDLKWQYIGLAMISGGFMFAILLWIIFHRKRKHVFFHHELKPNS